MTENVKNENRMRKFWLVLLFFALAAYTIKNIFVGADIDEGYGIMVGYRLAKGDRLLLEMWEPHQTSALFTALFIRLFLWITGGSIHFLNLYLRFIFFMIHGSIAYCLYRTLKKTVPEIGHNVAVLIGLFFYVTSPKSIFIPEYSNLHIWFFTLLILCLMSYYCFSKDERKLRHLVLAGICLTCDVLAYPSMAILFFFCVAFILFAGAESKGKECLAFIAPCFISALVFLGYLLTYMSLTQIFEMVGHVLGEGSHQVPAAQKFFELLNSYGQMALIILVAVIPAFIITVLYSKQNDKATVFLMSLFISLTVCQIGFYFGGSFNAIHPQTLYMALPLAGIYCYYRSGKVQKTGFFIILLSFVSYFAVLLLSNWPPILLNTYLLMGVIGGLLCWSAYLEKHATDIRKKLLEILCLSLILCNAFGYSYLIIGGDHTHSPIYTVRGYNHQGLRAGIFTSYMTSYRYNQNNAIWSEAVPDGSTVLYVGPSQFYCMLGEHTQACPDTICSLIYDEHLLDYWEINPDRYPDVVIVESWFGDIRTVEEDSFIMQWIENDFRPSEKKEYSYITVFYK